MFPVSFTLIVHLWGGDLGSLVVPELCGEDDSHDETIDSHDFTENNTIDVSMTLYMLARYSLSMVIHQTHICPRSGSFACRCFFFPRLLPVPDQVLGDDPWCADTTSNQTCASNKDSPGLKKKRYQVLVSFTVKSFPLCASIYLYT